VSAIIADAGVLVALLVRSDQHHSWARTQALQLAAPFHTCEAALAEAAHLLRRNGNDETILVDWLRQGLLHIPFAVETEADAVKSLLQTYRSVPMSLADACLVRMAELDDKATIFTTDADFLIYRAHGRQPLRVILPIPH
jgi:predicted nucleic acid-binding protein